MRRWRVGGGRKETEGEGTRETEREREREQREGASQPARAPRHPPPPLEFPGRLLGGSRRSGSAVGCREPEAS